MHDSRGLFWEVNSQTVDIQAHGTFSSSQSKIDFYGITTFCENYSSKSGGAIHISESLMYVYGSLLIVNNAANYSGGGTFFHLADVLCHGHCDFSHNKANNKGGGIIAISTIITLKYTYKWKPSEHERISLTVNDNQVEFGGDVYFEVGSKLYGIENSDYHYSIEFVRNSATHDEGAVFIQDKTYSDVCDSTSTLYQAQTGCFFQTLYSSRYDVENIHHLVFVNNTASKGSVLYGGLLDRCTVILSDTLHNKGIQNTHTDNSDALAHFLSESGTNSTNEIASDAVRVCFCDGMTSNSSLMYEPPPIHVKKELFNVTIVAVDQINHPVSATIHGSLPRESIFGEGQHLQNTTEVCTNLMFRHQAIL